MWLPAAAGACEKATSSVSSMLDMEAKQDKQRAQKPIPSLVPDCDVHVDSEGSPLILDSGSGFDRPFFLAFGTRLSQSWAPSVFVLNIFTYLLNVS